MPKAFVGEASRRWAHQLDDLRERWQLRTETSTYDEFMPCVLFEQDIQKLSHDELVSLKLQIEELLSSVKKDLIVARGRVAKYGEYSDPKWYAETLAVAKSIGRHCQIVQRQCGAVPRKARQRAVADHFIDICREWLDPEVFKTILQAAKDRADAQS